MEPLSRITAATVDVLRCLASESEPTWGLQVVKSSQRPAGTVYPLLERLERAGWVESEWEFRTDRPGPRRRLYSLTTDGAASATATIRSFDARASATARVVTA